MHQQRYKYVRKVQTITDMSPISSDAEPVGHLSRPRRLGDKSLFNLETVFVMARRNYKIYANLAST